jgi:hypothetical protein
MSRKKQLTPVEALSEIVEHLYPLKANETVLSEICETAEDALYKGGVKKWAKDNGYRPITDRPGYWSHRFGSCTDSLLVDSFLNSVKVLHAKRAQDSKHILPPPASLS